MRDYGPPPENNDDSEFPIGRAHRPPTFPHWPLSGTYVTQLLFPAAERL
jgi:hypothetical protein